MMQRFVMGEKYLTVPRPTMTTDKDEGRWKKKRKKKTSVSCPESFETVLVARWKVQE
jgi:hypothetical protein